MDDESRTTCLNPDCHDKNIKDHLLHFLGCIEISERHDFMEDPEYKLWKQETEHWITKLRQAGNQHKQWPAEEMKDSEVESKAREKSQVKREAWRDDCLSELRRIDFLRLKLKQDPQEKHLVESVEKSRHAWENSKEYKANIDSVKFWGAGRRKHNGKPYENLRKESMDKPYEPSRDVNAPFMQFEKQNPSDWTFAPVDVTPDSSQAIWGKYPNQKTTVQRLLYPEEGQLNLLSKKKDKTRLKYFHVPSNNMTVSHLPPSLLSHCIGGLLYLGSCLPRSLHPCTCLQTVT